MVSRATMTATPVFLVKASMMEFLSLYSHGMDFCPIGERGQVIQVMSSRPWPRRDVASRLRHFGARARRVRLFIVIPLFHKGCLENSRFLLSPTGHWAVGDNKNLEFPSQVSRPRLAHEHGSKDFPTNNYWDL